MRNICEFLEACRFSKFATQSARSELPDDLEQSKDVILPGNYCDVGLSDPDAFSSFTWDEIALRR
jgi:hypothetical protein